MEPDSNDKIPNFFLKDDNNTEDLEPEKNKKTNSFEYLSKTTTRSSKLTIHWSSLGIGAGIAIACM
nr:hypothetical protein [Nitrosopumilus sp.]